MAGRSVNADAEVDRILLAGPAESVCDWAFSQHLVAKGHATAFVANQSVWSANGLITAIDPLVHHYVGVCRRMATTDVNRDALMHSFHLEVASACTGPWMGWSNSRTCDVVVGLTARFRLLLGELQDAGELSSRHDVVRLTPKVINRPVSVTGTGITVLAGAALDRLLEEEGQSNYQYKLERIKSLLGLRPAELARLLNVTREGLRQWQSGAGIAPDRRPAIDELFEIAEWLGLHIKPNVVPSFIRRQIPVLNNQTPLDWLTTRRREFVDIYRRGFSVETTR
jgi:transcriptional regulator with XRE-family HTH domain